jgi:hypothetical protein
MSPHARLGPPVVAHLDRRRGPEVGAASEGSHMEVDRRADRLTPPDRPRRACPKSLLRGRSRPVSVSSCHLPEQVRANGWRSLDITTCREEHQCTILVNRFMADPANGPTDLEGLL